MKHALVLAAVLAAITAQAQTAPSRLIRATGSATLSSKPDQVKLTVGVTTQAATAQAAAEQNATQVTLVLSALQKTLGAAADIKTVSYTISPMYRYPTGQPAQLTGYSATNTVEVTTSDLSVVGKVIDAAVQAGATNIGSLRFALRDPEPLRALALAAAAKQAKAHADAIASGLGANTGSVITAEEGSVSTISPSQDTRGVTSTTTPVEAGLVQVTATVTITAELTR